MLVSRILLIILLGFVAVVCISVFFLHKSKNVDNSSTKAYFDASETGKNSDSLFEGEDDCQFHIEDSEPPSFEPFQNCGSLGAEGAIVSKNDLVNPRSGETTRVLCDGLLDSVPESYKEFYFEESTKQSHTRGWGCERKSKSLTKSGAKEWIERRAKSVTIKNEQGSGFSKKGNAEEITVTELYSLTY